VAYQYHSSHNFDIKTNTCLSIVADPNPKESETF
jgi:hypothetical protein